MKKITSISNDAKQSMNIILDDGSKAVMVLQYIQANKGWYFSLIYGSSFEVNNRRITTSPNMLRQFKDILSFGISCVTTDGYEPLYKDDFVSERATLYLLNEDDVDHVETSIIPAYYE